MLFLALKLSHYTPWRHLGERRYPFSFTISKKNIVVECLTLLLRIREVLSSNLGPETGYPDWGFS
jgi:hypothetical protein